ncbi:hypothetical protein KUTeg_012633 [Tegillarca granosa]|uniref:Uncharacterized protein n=1 Tax=Tegillarca granosa TaxID=220873 RepID=A0ABQ9F5C0_TEGGR|nr:hypothetical protein KUTeg_012633 [Tegillarca granosa]
MFPRLYSAAKTPQSSPTPTTPVYISNTSHEIPGEETVDTESDISLSVAESDEHEETGTKIEPKDLLSLWGGNKVSLSDEKDAEKYSEHRSSISWVSRSDEDMLGYGELADWEKEFDSIDSEKQPLMIPLSVTSYLCGRKRLTIGSFPTVSNRILCALASDNLAGEPFKKFLNKQMETLDLGYLHFWSDVRHYLDTDEAYLDPNGKPMKKVLGQKISYKYLQSKGEYCGIFSEGLKMALLQSMSGEDHISLLCTAQDIVTGCGNKRYDRNVVEMSHLNSDGKDPLLFINVTGQPDMASTTGPTSMSMESRPWSHASDFGVVYLSEEEMWRAFEITVLCSQYGRFIV